MKNQHTTEEVIELFNEFCEDNTVYHKIESAKDHFLKEKGLIQQFEVGRWYEIQKQSYHKCNAIICFQGNNEHSYGINFSGEWEDMFTGGSHIWGVNFTRRVTPATDKEVEEALIKETLNLFKIGNKIIDADESGDEDYITIGDCSDEWILSDDRNKLYWWGMCVFYNGKWADIVEEKKPDPMTEVKKKIEALSIIAEAVVKAKKILEK